MDRSGRHLHNGQFSSLSGEEGGRWGGGGGERKDVGRRRKRDRIGDGGGGERSVTVAFFLSCVNMSLAPRFCV